MSHVRIRWTLSRRLVRAAIGAGICGVVYVTVVGLPTGTSMLSGAWERAVAGSSGSEFLAVRFDDAPEELASAWRRDIATNAKLFGDVILDEPASIELGFAENLHRATIGLEDAAHVTLDVNAPIQDGTGQVAPLTGADTRKSQSALRAAESCDDALQALSEAALLACPFTAAHSGNGLPALTPALTTQPL